MIEDADRTLIPTLYENVEHALFMFPFPDGEDLWLGSRGWGNQAPEAGGSPRDIPGESEQLPLFK